MDPDACFFSNNNNSNWMLYVRIVTHEPEIWNQSTRPGIAPPLSGAHKQLNTVLSCDSATITENTFLICGFKYPKYVEF